MFDYSRRHAIILSAEKHTGDWLRGRAYPSHGWGHKFESCIAHHRTLRSEQCSGLFVFEPKRAVLKFPKFIVAPAPELLYSTSSHGGVAQLGERLTGSQEVRGSIPLVSTLAKQRGPASVGPLFCYRCRGSNPVRGAELRQPRERLPSVARKARSAAAGGFRGAESGSPSSPPLQNREVRLRSGLFFVTGAGDRTPFGARS